MISSNCYERSKSGRFESPMFLVIITFKVQNLLTFCEINRSMFVQDRKLQSLLVLPDEKPAARFLMAILLLQVSVTYRNAKATVKLYKIVGATHC